MTDPNINKALDVDDQANDWIDAGETTLSNQSASQQQVAINDAAFACRILVGFSLITPEEIPVDIAIFLSGLRQAVAQSIANSCQNVGTALVNNFDQSSDAETNELLSLESNLNSSTVNPINFSSFNTAIVLHNAGAVSGKLELRSL